MKISFNQMPATARAWVYTANRVLSDAESDHLLKQLDPFLEEWSSHGAPLKASAHVLDGAVVVVAVENGWEEASGCSIDKSVRVLKNLEAELQVALFDRMQILYRESSSAPITILPLAQLKQKLANGDIYPSGNIVDTQVATMGEVKDQLWKEIKNSWLARFLPSTTV